MVMLVLDSPNIDLVTDKNNARSPKVSLAPFKSDQVKNYQRVVTETPTVLGAAQ